MNTRQILWTVGAVSALALGGYALYQLGMQQIGRAHV
jgi:hypothetical protein